ncbi:hypothetical protein TNCV_4954861 [Trichonephila clavipes]|nr:hypothetical protein TNCV_4954861 [Trichonephila clavipes]
MQTPGVVLKGSRSCKPPFTEVTYMTLQDTAPRALSCPLFVSRGGLHRGGAVSFPLLVDCVGIEVSFFVFNLLAGFDYTGGVTSFPFLTL